MARQVSGSDKSLLVAIRDGEVPRPPLVDWNNWQIWRRDHGRRPTSSEDGYVTTPTLEANIWKTVMEELHGENWMELIASGETPATAAAGLPQQLRELRILQQLVADLVCRAHVREGLGRHPLQLELLLLTATRPPPDRVSTKLPAQ